MLVSSQSGGIKILWKRREIKGYKAYDRKCDKVENLDYLRCQTVIKKDSMFFLQNMKENFCMPTRTKLAFAASSTVLLPRNLKNSPTRNIYNRTVYLRFSWSVEVFLAKSSTKRICITIKFYFGDIESTQDSLTHCVSFLQFT